MLTMTYFSLLSGTKPVPMKGTRASDATSIASAPMRTAGLLSRHHPSVRSVERGHSAAALFDVLDLGPEHRPLRHERDDRDRDSQRREQRERHRDGKRLEDLADDARDQAQRQEHRHRRQRRGRDRRGDLRDCDADRLRRALVTPREVPVDVLDDDDRVVDDSPDGHRQSAERHHVERDARLIERDEAREHGQRNRDDRDDRRAPVAQEQQDDDEREQRAEQALFAACP